ncbi:MAG: photosystem I reaction center subunit XII [Pseudanabaena sp.]|jgi:photosystem I reaction center subunit XII|nr:photosystem I reaction center subunit XII [Pseudanabaena sp. UWO311]MCA6504096.1 photosystem I reaction center subunit XII [Pseudanabaena sp. M090S1SP2A07QC]MCA6505847.1 photosystem I reaction center subunit XII [Pseudanabaena sp. M172S2SP2A07QC]MCA6510992.1 photosystem I reaction center subunit XII [Pseudanabaena sp. M109S1SP2A07QC]MCA6517237.1 photosystem I reaction center subunit XII [Pseudanabaena sp. M110S1SP2A07QC]MCA6521243.1 photosystem I reaction center subunit XII [Pseudanabaena s
MNLSDGQVFTALLVSLFPAVMAALLGSALSNS